MKRTKSKKQNNDKKKSIKIVQKIVTEVLDTVQNIDEYRYFWKMLASLRSIREEEEVEVELSLEQDELAILAQSLEDLVVGSEDIEEMELKKEKQAIESLELPKAAGGAKKKETKKKKYRQEEDKENMPVSIYR